MGQVSPVLGRSLSQLFPGPKAPREGREKLPLVTPAVTCLLPRTQFCGPGLHLSKPLFLIFETEGCEELSMGLGTPASPHPASHDHPCFTHSVGSDSVTRVVFLSS